MVGHWPKNCAFKGKDGASQTLDKELDEQDLVHRQLVDWSSRSQVLYIPSMFGQDGEFSSLINRSMASSAHLKHLQQSFEIGRSTLKKALFTFSQSKIEICCLLQARFISDYPKEYQSNHRELTCWFVLKNTRVAITKLLSVYVDVFHLFEHLKADDIWPRVSKYPYH